MAIRDFESPMDAVKALTNFLDTLDEDSVKVQILEIYLEDNPEIRTKLIEYLKLDGLI